MRRLRGNPKVPEFYFGPFIGGPMHGGSLRHDAPVYRVPRAPRRLLDFIKDGARLPPLAAAEILGEYRWEPEGDDSGDGVGVWQWKTLIGPQR